MGDDVCTIYPEHWWKPRTGFWHEHPVFSASMVGISGWLMWVVLANPDESRWKQAAVVAAFIIAVVLALNNQRTYRSRRFRITSEGLVIKRAFLGERIAIAWNQLTSIEYSGSQQQFILGQRDGRKHKLLAFQYGDVFQLRDALMAFAPEDVVAPELPVYLREWTPRP